MYSFTILRNATYEENNGQCASKETNNSQLLGIYLLRCVVVLATSDTLSTTIQIIRQVLKGVYHELQCKSVVHVIILWLLDQFSRAMLAATT